jgi:NADH-quinone oxidoreductase subunit L
MFRLLFITFSGTFRGTEEERHHLHESPIAMTLPLIILAVLSVIGGFVGVPRAVHAWRRKAYRIPVAGYQTKRSTACGA